MRAREGSRQNPPGMLGVCQCCESEGGGRGRHRRGGVCGGACEGAGRERCVRLAEGAREPGEIESTETTREIERCGGGIQGNIEKKEVEKK